jgi:adhesin transport system outer membrane protein
MKKVNTYVTTAAVALLTCSAAPLQAKAETLQEAIQYMLDTNPEVRSSAYIRKSRDEVVRIAKADYYPRLDFSAGTGVQQFDEPIVRDTNPVEYRLSLRQNLFTGFGTKYDVERTKHSVNSGAYRVQATSSDTALRGAQTYLDVQRRQELIDLAELNLKNHLRIEDQIKLRSASGVARKADMDQVQGRVALARTDLLSSKANMVDAQTNYFAVIGHMPENLSQPESPDTLLPKSLDEAQRQAIVNHPTLLAGEEDLAARESQHGIAKSEYYPKLDLELDKRWEDEVDGFEGKEEDWLAMLRLRYNFFSGFRHSGRKQETKYLIEDAREARNDIARQALESIRLSWATYESELAKQQDFQDRVTATEKTVKAYIKQWDIGKRTLLDLLDSGAESINSRVDLINSKFQLESAKYRLLNGTGRLVSALALAYPEEANVEYFEDKE